jgi:hypothetical protein
MERLQKRAWIRTFLSAALAALFGALTHGALTAWPAIAASGFPNCDGGGAPSMPPLSADVFTVTGIVRDAGDTPVECVQAFAFSGAVQVYTYTNSAGRFTLTLDLGVFYDLVLNPPIGLGLASQSERGIHDSQDLSVTLPPGHSISGTVYRDEAKTNPVANTAIFAFNTDTFGGFGLPPTQSTGNYQISLEEGHWELTFTPPPFASLGPTRTAAISLTADTTTDIILPAGFTVHGRVITSSGESQSNVEIFAQDPSQAPIGYGFTPSGQGGAFTGSLPLGNFDVQFLAPPFLELGSTVITNVMGPGDVRLTVTLPAGHTASGWVTCGAGVANAFVHAAPEIPIPGDDINGYGRFAGSDGFYALALVSGTYTFTVAPPAGSLLPGREVPSVVVTQNVTLNFDLCTFLPIVARMASAN